MSSVRPRPRPLTETESNEEARRGGLVAGAQGYDAQQAALSPNGQAAQGGKEDEKDPLKVPRGQVTFDSEGLENEGGAFHSRVLHWPGSWSGVTIGRGYDMKLRTQPEVKSDLLAAGVDAATAETMSKGAGLKGNTAKAFVRSNRGLEITPEAQQNLFDVVYMEKFDYAKKLIAQWTGTDLEAAHPAIKDLLVDLFYRGDMTRTKWKRHDFKTLVAESNFSGLRALLARQSLWGNVDRNRYDMRLAFLDQESKRPDSAP